MSRKDDYNYFEFFKQMTALACQAAGQIDELAAGYDRDQLNKRSRTLRDIEHKADSLKHQMTSQLMREFLPPIDREDILELSGLLDDIVDAIDDVAHALHMFDITVCRPDIKDFTALVVGCCTELSKVMAGFERYKKNANELRTGLVEVNRLEGEGDRLYTEAVRRLFTDGTDAIAVCAWKSVYDYLETCCDACEHVADQVDTVLLKNN